MSMTHRQRAVAAIRGEAVDHIPFIGRMELWYNYNCNRGTLPEKYRGWSLWDIQRDLNIGIFGFGVWTASFYRLEYPASITVQRTTTADEAIVEYVTPYGTVRARNLLAEELRDADVTGAQVEHEFKDERDYDALQYLFENTKVVDNFEEYGRVVEAIGEDGLALPYSGWLPMHVLMHHYLGYENFYYQLHDNTAKVEQLHQALVEQQRQILKLGARCPAEVVEVGGNYDESMTPPVIFEKYMVPFYREAAQTLHAGGKLMAAHLDGEMQRLLDIMPSTGLDVGEAITPAPMTSIDIRHLRSLWQGKMAMWGGIPTVLLTNSYSDEEFERYVVDLFAAVAPGDRFILGFGDNAPTDALFSRLAKTAELWQRYGRLPVR
ncbi:MAG: uroporphyrinogen decarboxylase family protein [Chloroflexota bacterium]